jgi:acyl carrier protein
MNIEYKIRDIVCQQLDIEPEQVNMGDVFVEDLGVDSLSAMEIVLALEEEFEIDIPDGDADKLLTLRDAVEYIAVKISESS